MQDITPFALEKADGIEAFDEDRLARDPSLIVGYPSPPGATHFHVDDLQQIRPGNQILFSTEAERDPAHIARALGELHRARRELDKYLPGSDMHARWKKETERLQKIAVQFYQGKRRLKSLRYVVATDPATRRIIVDRPFERGYKPRVMGCVVRVIGFETKQVDTIGTEILHQKAKEIYGSYDWQSEFNTTGKFPDTARQYHALGRAAAGPAVEHDSFLRPGA